MLPVNDLDPHQTIEESTMPENDNFSSDLRFDDIYVEKAEMNEPWARWAIVGAWEDEFSGGACFLATFRTQREAKTALYGFKEKYQR